MAGIFLWRVGFTTELAPGLKTLRFMAILLRKMEFRDLLCVQRINIKNSTENFLLSTFLNTLSTSYSTSFVSEANGIIIGYIEAVANPNEGKGHIYSLCVDGPFRRCGIGRRLIELAIKAIRVELRGMDYMFEIDLHVRVTNTGAIALYESMGFAVVEVGIPYYESGALAHRMSIELSL